MIKQIVLKNYKSIKDSTLDLGGINLLIGGNGAGKTNFISFFELLLAVYNQRLGEYVLGRGGPDRLLYNGVKNSDKIEAVVNFDDKNALSLDLRPVLESNKLFIARITDYFNGKDEPGKNYCSWQSQIWDSMTEESSIRDKDSFGSACLKKYLSALQVYHFHDTGRTAKMRFPSAIDDCLNLRRDASNLAACIYKMQQKSPKNFLLLQAVVRSVAPYFKRFDLSPSSFDRNSVVLRWEAAGTDDYFDAHAFSDGTIRFVALATLLLQEHKPATIVINEPELGLHPFAIVKLAALIQQAAFDSQIIIATQSTNLISQFSPEDIIVVDRKENQSTFCRLDGHDLDCWLEHYSLGDIWEKNIIGGQPQ